MAEAPRLRPRLQGLDALRGIAALCVVALHTNAVFGGVPWFAKGYLGVDFFLMLSGYLMARITEPRLAAGLSPVKFMRARYRRFWPMVALGSLIGTPYLWVRASGDWGAFLPALIANFLLLPWPLTNLLFALNIPVWTIFFELLANAAHVFALRFLSTVRLAILTGSLGALTIWVALHIGTLDLGARPATFLPGIPRILLAYCIGMLIWRTKGERPLAPVPGWLAVIAMPAALLAAWYFGWRGPSFDLAFAILLCPLVLAGALRITRPNPLVWLSAAISFPVFAVHLPILEATRELGYGKVPALCVVALVTAIIVVWTNRRVRRKEPAPA